MRDEPRQVTQIIVIERRSDWARELFFNLSAGVLLWWLLGGKRQ